MRSLGSRTGNGWAVAILGGLALLAPLPLLTPRDDLLNFVLLVLLSITLAQSWNIIAGYAGQVNLGHAAFFGLGAYTVHLLRVALGATPVVFLSMAASVLACGGAALLIGALALRTRGFFFLMTTLAFGQMLYFLFHDTQLGGGMDGVFIQRPDLLWPVPRAARPAVFLWLNLGVLVAMYAGLWGLMRTLFGHALLGIRANEHRMRAMGHDVQRLKLAAFVVAGALAGVAGHMAALTDAFVSPDLLGWHRSAEALLMILLGGIGALHGPILGAFALILIQELSQLVTERQRLVEGAVILLAVLLLRHGLAGRAR